MRRIGGLVAVTITAVAFYYLGKAFLWPIPEPRVIHTVGIVEAQEVNITSRIAGRIAVLSLDEGDTIEAGQVVCRIEHVDIKNQLAKAEADLANAVAELNNAQRTRRRDEDLFVQNVISAQAYDDVLARAEKDRAAVQAAQATLRYFKDQLADTSVRSPIAGVVVSKNLHIGEWVNAGTPILTVDDLSDIWARADLEETQLGFIQVGSPAQVALPTQPPVLLHGQVVAIGQEGQFATETGVRRGRQDIRTFYVKVRLLQAGGIAK
ncbi:MAG: efflux RND transporter periplasmic adaptor subunit, partial [Deltaproteobacteria bacterium]|nr:efflux RND transporter periplasmic adaptor subunit [Deltaproteobacteria bacterium]